MFWVRKTLAGLSSPDISADFELDNAENKGVYCMGVN
jgi:hypothetical protein